MNARIRVQPPVPAQLCKYRSYGSQGVGGRDVETVHALLSGRLRFARPDSFNDPFEGRPQHKAAFNNPGRQRLEFMRYLARIAPIQGSPTARRGWAATWMGGKSLQDVIDYLDEAEVRDGERGARIYSTAHPNTVKKPLLWSHYSDSHRGICVHLDATRYPLRLSWQVGYAEEYPTLLVPRTASPDWSIMEETHLKKSVLWAYEEEFRVVRLLLPDAGAATHLNVQWDGDIAICDPQIVSEVTLGARMPSHMRQQLLAWIEVNAPHVQVWQATLHRHRFELERREQLR